MVELCTLAIMVVIEFSYFDLVIKVLAKLF